MSSLRSAGWSVRPSFVPHGPTTDVTLLCDERGLTQLAGIPDVAWQTPWGELEHVQLVRVARGMALFATAAGVRYCWRNRDLEDYEALRAIVVEHGGVATRRRRRVGVLVVVGVVLLASFAGGIAAVFTSSGANAKELSSARKVNLTLKDLPSGWYKTSESSAPLSLLFSPSGQVITSTTAPANPPKASPILTEVTSQFQKCLGVSNARDRVYGAAGQEPNYQVSSPIFTSNSFGGIELASTTQYYATTLMVHEDVGEMSMSQFGPCFVASQVAILKAVADDSSSAPTVAPGTNWQPLTFAKAWSRAGEESLTLPTYTGTLHLVMVVMATGHFETTMGALVSSWPQSQSFLANAVNTLLSRMISPNAAAV